MRGMATTTLMSFAEFERLEWGADEVELLNGELIRMPPPIRSHMMTCEALYRSLEFAVEHLRRLNPDRQFDRVHIEMGYYFPGEPGSWLSPDVSLTHPDQPGDRYCIGAPLIAFEVVSKNDTATDLDRKVSVYLANGAAEVWLIYPLLGHALVFNGSGVRNETHAVRTDLLPGVEIPLDQILG
jgi:Uma2 family endonuclease